MSALGAIKSVIPVPLGVRRQRWKGKIARAGTQRGSFPPTEQVRMLLEFEDGRSPASIPLPPGYRMVRVRPQMYAQWAQLLERSGEFDRFGTDRLETDMLAHLLPRAAYLVMHGDEAVACAAMCYMREFHPYAVLMYVVTLPEHRGRQLGKAVTVETLKDAYRCGHPGVVLHTDEERAAAIHVYETLGFRRIPSEGEPAQ